MPKSDDDAIVAELMTVPTYWGRVKEDLARVALRRWQTYRRRHPKARQITHEDRVIDLAKAVQRHIDPTGVLDHPSDVRAVAAALAEALARLTV
jgi:hypothetical protein